MSDPEAPAGSADPADAADPPNPSATDTPSTTGAAPKPRRRRRRRRRLVWAAIVVVVLWLASAGVVIALGLLHASHGMADVNQAKSHLTASDVVDRSATAPLHAAVKEFDSADGLLHSPLLAPLDIVPVIGRQLRSVQDLSSASGQVAEIGAGAIDQAHGVLQSPHSSGADRVVELRRLAALAANTDRALGKINTGPAQALVAPLASKHDTFVRDLTDVRTRLQHAAGVAGTMADILNGPQTYLLLMANNAEMRAGSGDFLEVGALATHDGHLQLSNLNQTVNIPVAPGKVTVTGDLEARWGWLKAGQDHGIAVELRQRVDLADGDDARDLRVGGLHAGLGGRGLDPNAGGDISQLQRDDLARDLGNRKGILEQHFPAEARRLDRDGVGAGGQRRKQERALIIGGGGVSRSRVVIHTGHESSSDGSSGGVEDDATQTRAGSLG